MHHDTGASDEVFNLVSVLYHALEGADVYQRYIDDARQAGHADLAQFFEQCQREDAERARRAQELLNSLYAEHGGPSTGGDGGAAGLGARTGS